jgi:AmmeMemoRadiSam system protein B/AmmeMemoRadiSam system protein A
VAGSFYPDDPVKLRGAVEAFLAEAVPSGGERPVVLVAPHAGYVFSGQIAADAWNQAAGHHYDVIVILGANHRSEGFVGISIFEGEGYRTPLGVARIDPDLSRRLRRAGPRFTYRPEAHTREHSVEVQVPFAQILFPDVPLVTAVVGSPDADMCREVGLHLAAILKDRRPLIVASTDLSHFPDYDDAVAADSALLRSLAAADLHQAPFNLQRAVTEEAKRQRPGLVTSSCGRAPLLVALSVAPELGALRTTVLSYANSGDTSLGDRSRVVGYGALALTGRLAPNSTAGLIRPETAPPGTSLSSSDRRDLLDFARQTIERYLATETVPLARDFGPAAWGASGAFVTLKKDDELRGCIGHLQADRPLCQVVGEVALKAAFEDGRFAPVMAGEMAEIQVEISVLTPFEKVTGPQKVRVGIDGVLLRKAGKSAVFLPQVATEQGWDREEMLGQLCRKAGLAATAWQSNAEIWTFQAEVFGESHSP